MNLYKLYLSSQIFYLISNYHSYSWILQSNFNYLNPDLSLLNIAMPSAISYYYITILDKNNMYSFNWKYPNNNESYQTSLTFYDIYGNLLYDDNDKPYYLDNQLNYNNTCYNFTSTVNSIVILRFYLNRNYDYNVPSNWLLDIYKNNIKLTILDENQRIILSNKLQKPLMNYISYQQKKYIHKETPFYLTDILNGLFPSPTHFYLICFPGKHKAMYIKGKNIINDNNPYFDFITVNDITTDTNNGIPFYDLPTNYEFIVADDDYHINVNNNNINNLPIIRWDKNTKPYQRLLIFRIINYNNTKLLTYYNKFSTFTLTPEETKTIIGDSYPEVYFI